MPWWIGTDTPRKPCQGNMLGHSLSCFETRLESSWSIFDLLTSVVFWGRCHPSSDHDRQKLAPRQMVKRQSFSTTTFFADNYNLKDGLDRGGSSSGNTSDNGSRGQVFDPPGSWATLFLISSVSYLLIMDATLIRSLVEGQHNWFSTFQKKMEAYLYSLRRRKLNT